MKIRSLNINWGIPALFLALIAMLAWLGGLPNLIAVSKQRLSLRYRVANINRAVRNHKWQRAWHLLGNAPESLKSNPDYRIVKSFCASKVFGNNQTNAAEGKPPTLKYSTTVQLPSTPPPVSI